MFRWKVHALHILDCIEKIRRIEERGSVLEDEVLYAATLRHLQTLAEATQQIPESHKANEPAIPWRDILMRSLISRHSACLSAIVMTIVARRRRAGVARSTSSDENAVHGR